MYKYSIQDPETGEKRVELTSRQMQQILGIGRSRLTGLFINGDRKEYKGYICRREYIPLEQTKGMTMDEIEDFVNDWRDMQKLFGVTG